jgi:peroxiredoxin (alkyl hydroperoxide reductase subunit C)
MSIQIGDKMPSGSFGLMTGDGPSELSSDELFAGKKVVLFSVPGAFTPTCSLRHLPGFVDLADEFFENGVDTIACMAVNDVHVMHAWGKDRGVGDKVMMLADGSCIYTQALGLEVDSSRFGMGMRSKRFALVVDDGIVTHIAIESPGQFDVSSAEAILASL